MIKMIKNYLKNRPKCRPIYRCDFAIPPHQQMKSFSLLPHLESRLRHVIFFAQWNINKNHTWETLKTVLHWGFTSLPCWEPTATK